MDTGINSTIGFGVAGSGVVESHRRWGYINHLAMTREPSPEIDSEARLDAEFEAIVDEYQAPLLRYAGRIMNNRVLAQDVVQCAFIKLSRSWKAEYVPSPPMSAWLYRVTHNCAVDMIRKVSRRQDLHDRNAEEQRVRDDKEDQPRRYHEDTSELVNAALEVLDIRERQLVILKIYEEKSYNEMSEITGLGQGNVGYILHHAMKKLAKRIKALREPS